MDADEALEEAVPDCIQRELLVIRHPLGVDAFLYVTWRAFSIRAQFPSGSRLDAFARFMLPRKAIYSLGYVPVDATWGTGRHAEVLCDPVGRLDIWAMGYLERFAYTTDISAPTSISVTISLLRECDRSRMTNLLRRTSPKSSESTPPSSSAMTSRPSLSELQDLESTTSLKASVEYPGKAMVREIIVAYRSVGINVRSQVFRSVYDATVSYEAASLMKRLCVTDLCPGDYVLVECMLVRNISPQDGSWTVKFELCSLSLLSGAARRPVPEHDSGFRGEM